MKILITRACGFVRGTIAEELARLSSGYQLLGLDNPSRAGSEVDLPRVKKCGVLAGAGQFGKPDQGVLPFWIHSGGRALAHPEWLDLSSSP
jgi:nucleoside-diphosphate-sugar epimerase